MNSVLNRIAIPIFAICCCSIISSAAKAQLPFIPKIRVKAGLFLPTDSNLTNAVGNTWMKIGVDVTLPLGFNLPIIGASTKVGIDYSFKNSNRIVPITLSEVIQPSAGAHSPIYAGAGIGLWNAKIGGNTSSKVGFRLLGGLDFSEKLFLEAQYDKVGRLGGVTADGFSVLAGFKF